MEQKQWPWKKHSNKSKTFKALQEETERGRELEKSVNYLNEKIECLLAESDAKDGLLEKQEKVAEESLAGWERAEANAASLKKELDDALQQTVAAEERLRDLDQSLKECMQQLRAVQEEREIMINDAAIKASIEEEKARVLEERLSEAEKAVANLVTDHDSLNSVLEAKEKMIKDLNEHKRREGENRKAILGKLDAAEKQNASLKYEVYMLGKELQIRNEEKDFNLKSVKASHRQHLSNVKRITELEEECNKLRVMLRKKFPGPAALAKMKTEVELLDGNGNASPEAPKKKPSLKKNGIAEKTSSKMDSLVERVREMGEENKMLKEELAKRGTELLSSRLMYTHNASKLSHVEKQLISLSRSATIDTEVSNASNSENGGNEDSVSLSESWASAPASELDHLKNGLPVTPTSKVGVLDISLMDDFLEMEKLAITSSNKPHDTSLSDLNGETPSSCVSNGSSSFRVKDILRPILQKHHVEPGIVNAILEEIRIALSDTGCTNGRDYGHSINESLEITSQDALTMSFREADCMSLLSSEHTAQQFQTNLDKSIFELIEVLEELKEKSLTDHVDDKEVSGSIDGGFLQKKSAGNTDIVTQVFQWKSLELKEALERFLQACNMLLRGSIGLQKFIREMTSTINWIVDHSHNLHETSDNTSKENEAHHGVNEPYPETDKASVPEEVKLTIETPISTSELAVYHKKSIDSITRNNSKEWDDARSAGTQDDISNASQELSGSHFGKSAKTTLSLQIELERLKEAKGSMGNHVEQRKVSSGHLDLQEACQSFPSLKEALECTKASSADLQAQQERVSREEKPSPCKAQEQKHLQTNWEISVASERLAECQETILSIEKQLKALTASGNVTSHRPALRDQMLADDNENLSQSVTDDAKEKEGFDMQLIPRPTQSSDKVGLLYGMTLAPTQSNADQAMTEGSQIKSHVMLNGSSLSVGKHGSADAGNALAIVPRKHRATHGSLWRRLLVRRRNKEGGLKMIKV